MVVSYAVERRILAGKPDYWDYATRLELAVLAGDENRAGQSLADVLAANHAAWERETTVRNLRLPSRSNVVEPLNPAFTG
jgi:hypothetical protein